MELRLEEDHPSIVIVGGFDARQMHPQWFRAEGLLGKAEAEGAKLKIVHQDIVDWSTDSLLVQMTPGRLLVRGTVESASDAVRDLVLGVLQILDRTVAPAVGLNRTMHFDTRDEGAWHRIGDRLAPKDLWREHLKNHIGMRALQIEESVRSDGLDGKTIVSVQPSRTFKHGVVFDVNNEIVNPLPDRGPGPIVEVIRDNWQRLLTEARTMAEAVLTKAAASS